MEPKLALHVTFVFDFVCPWCFLGRRKLEAALGTVDRSVVRVDEEWSWEPFRLVGKFPPTEGVNKKQFYLRKLGSEAAFEAMLRRLADAGAEVGVDRFAYSDDARIGNSLDAHRLLQSALVPSALKKELADELFRAHTERGESISRADVLQACVANARVPVSAAQLSAWLEGPSSQSERDAIIKRMDSAADEFDVLNGVPHAILTFRDAATSADVFTAFISGAQDVDTFRLSLNRFTARALSRLSATSAAAAAASAASSSDELPRL